MTTQAMKLPDQKFGVVKTFPAGKRSIRRDLQRSLHAQSAHPDVTKMSQLCVFGLRLFDYRDLNFNRLRCRCMTARGFSWTCAQRIATSGTRACKYGK